jgi:hypothetical protein
VPYLKNHERCRWNGTSKYFCFVPGAAWQVQLCFSKIGELEYLKKQSVCGQTADVRGGGTPGREQ